MSIFVHNIFNKALIDRDFAAGATTWWITLNIRDAHARLATVKHVVIIKPRAY